jgi:hypothetical protein
MVALGLNGVVTVTVASREWDTDGSGFMLLRRHLATAPSLRLGRPSASIGRWVTLQIERVVDGGMDTEEALGGSS